MNISPVNLVNFKSSVGNTQTAKQVNDVKATSPINYASASSEALKANYCPQVAFKGKDDSDKTAQLSKTTISEANEYIKSGDTENFKKMAEKLSKDELYSLLTTAAKKDEKPLAFELLDMDDPLFTETTKLLKTADILQLLQLEYESPYTGEVETLGDLWLNPSEE